MPRTGPAAARPADIGRGFAALIFAARAHANQRRESAAQEPHIDNRIEVADRVREATGGTDEDARVVVEGSEDMSLPKGERRRARIAAAARKSPRARLVKGADLISKLRAVAKSPPAGWGCDPRLGCLDGCRQVTDATRGTNPALDARFDAEAFAAARPAGSWDNRPPG